MRVYQDDILSTDSDEFDAQNESTPVLISHKTNLICSYISVEIPFRPDLQGNPAKPTLKKGNQKPLTALSLISLNGAQKAPKIPQNQLKSQLNDYISKSFFFILYFFNVFSD